MNLDKKQVTMLKWIINFAIPLAIFFIPTNESFTKDIRLFLVLTIFVIAMIALENLPIFTISLILPLLYLVVLQQPPSLVFTAWSLEVPWLILGGFVITIALKKSGLLLRVSYALILMLGGTIRGILYGLLVAGILVAMIISDQMVKAILVSSLVLGICEALEIKKGSRNGTVLGLALFVIALAPAFIFMTSTPFMSVSAFMFPRLRSTCC